MKFLVFGQTGQVGAELAALEHVLCLDRTDADLSDPEACARTIQTQAPDAVINAAAYTNVDAVENDPALAHVVNAEAPARMARECAGLSIPFISISTDYVFDGRGSRPYTPDDAPAPLNVYGSSKLSGERAILQEGGCGTILRTSWVFSSHGRNFVKTMLRLGQENQKLEIVSDQVGGPTPARDIAMACYTMAGALIIQPQKAGIYHFSGYPDTSWADLARETFSQAGLDCRVRDIQSQSYRTPATRPLNSRLDCTEIQEVFGIERPDWRMGLAEILSELEKDFPDE
ncbi:dTDP-4-dehydrorhamnose reductase [Shimia abyssi]|uniref:dTDP-4-dehydrorhamnose reductase n=1 Tax=Shimia abyssi TaxID=1662395 RepID=A0A2P8F7D1_9RHOB|nr:dTDP-4-dehydrorhamnose reductase [Shimia abyssi]PSL17629.1 dTDP-4-dehydrorhamnose reductase [Shimia abyssi]